MDHREDIKMNAHDQIRHNYDLKAVMHVNPLQRQTTHTFELKSFNNWIKSVLIARSTRDVSKKIQQALDLKIGSDSKLLHVLDIGCGRGQDIKKWSQQQSRVKYIVANDFSEECIKGQNGYLQKWKNMHEPYRLFCVTEDFTGKQLYPRIQHTYYDLVSAQFCFHYMFGKEEGLRNGLAAILSNLLIGGLFIATIPDAYTIIHKIKEKGLPTQDNSMVFGNKYFSIKFKTTDFATAFGNQYGFYLDEAVGEKDQDGNIKYTTQWLIELDSLQVILKEHGVVIEQTCNFLEYYKRYREEYKDLFPKFKLVYEAGQSMDPDLWQIAHLYRVLICRKVSKGRQLSDFTLKQRQESITRECKRTISSSHGNHHRQGNQGNNRNYSNSQGKHDGGYHKSSNYNKRY